MKKLPIILIALMIPLTAFAEIDCPSIDELQAYEDSLNVLRVRVIDLIPDGRLYSATLLKEYLELCKEARKAFGSLENDLLTSATLDSSIRARREKRDELLLIFMNVNEYLIEREILSRESDAYWPLARFKIEMFRLQLQARIILSDRKYYEVDDESKGSPIEMILNGMFGFTSTDLHDYSQPGFGVKPWELNFRFEPVGIFEDSDAAGVLVSLGTIWNYFPRVEIVDGELITTENFRSNHLKRWGLKLGAGGRYTDRFEWIAGAGLQVRAFTFYLLYDFDEEKSDRYLFAVGVNTLEWIKQVLPYQE